MPEFICKDSCLWVSGVGCRQTRIALLALEPGSRVWLNIENEPILFERMSNSTTGSSTRGFKPVGGTKLRWMALYLERKGKLLEFDFIERPDDEDAAGTGYFKRETA